MKTPCLALFLSTLLLGLPAAAEPVLQPQTQGEVRFVTGGVGAEENEALKAVSADYNLHLQFSAKDSGEFLSDVELRITDANGRVVLQTVSDGPKLFAKLQPGRYTIEAVYGGKTLRNAVTIAGQRGASLSLVWPESPEN
jgi:hypothetical protein